MQQTNKLIIYYRLFRILIHILIGILTVATIWPFVQQPTITKLTKWWSQQLLKCFNIRMVTTGQLPKLSSSNTLFLANHVSWVDIHALNSIRPLQFIAKSDISQWPVLGYLARKSGTIFINRKSKKDTARIVDTTTDHLVAGANVGFFPEGTTTDGTSLAQFKSSIVQAAINAKATLQPIAIRYPLPDGGVNTKMAYAGETTMGESMMHILKQKESIIELHFITPIPVHSTNRQTLTQMAYGRIAKKLNL